LLEALEGVDAWIKSGHSVLQVYRPQRGAAGVNTDTSEKGLEALIVAQMTGGSVEL